MGRKFRKSQDEERGILASWVALMNETEAQGNYRIKTADILTNEIHDQIKEFLRQRVVLTKKVTHLI